MNKTTTRREIVLVEVWLVLSLFVLAVIHGLVFFIMSLPYLWFITIIALGLVDVIFTATPLILAGYLVVLLSEAKDGHHD
jgi:hypothetical protein